MSRTTFRSLPIIVALVIGLLTITALGSLSVARGQEQASPSVAPQANTPTPTASPAPTTATVRITAYEDASVVSGGPWTPDTNLGGWNELATGSHDGGIYRDYLRFVLAGLPAGLQIDSAQLLLTPLETGSQPVNITAGVVQQDWSEASITWDQQPLATWQAAASTWQPNQAGPFALDLTQAARTWYACGGTSNDGIMLSADLASDWVVFASRKSAYPPVLAVTYETSSAPLDCVAAPTSTGGAGQAPSQPAPSTSGAQIGAAPISTPVPVTVNPGTLPCPTIFCLSRGSNVSGGSAGGSATGGSGAGGSTAGGTTGASSGQTTQGGG